MGNTAAIIKSKRNRILLFGDAKMLRIDERFS